MPDKFKRKDPNQAFIVTIVVCLSFAIVFGIGAYFYRSNLMETRSEVAVPEQNSIYKDEGITPSPTDKPFANQKKENEEGWSGAKKDQDESTENPM